LWLQKALMVKLSFLEYRCKERTWMLEKIGLQLQSFTRDESNEMIIRE
jgi:hypothetical protein